MKIKCSVEVVNRALPSLNMASKKAKNSILTIGKSSEDDHFILHQTNENMCGFKYKIKNNIKNVFVKFLNEGKATIRFKEPNHDLAIKCDPVQLKGFFKTLEQCVAGVQSIHLSSIHSISVKNKCMKPVKTKLKILSQEDYYPGLEGFPRTLQKLTISNLAAKRFDSKILRLRNLKILNLENNCLTTLPEVFGSSLPNLVELYLGNNNLGESRDWRWIVNKTLSKGLKLLDLSSNQIEFLPDKLVKLENLVTLNINSNCLKSLPNGIGCLKNLRHFYIQNNKIEYLPRSIFSLQITSLDVSDNNFCKEERHELSLGDFLHVPTLIDIAASCVIKNRLHYSADTVPQTVIDHLDNASFCICGNPSFSSQQASYVSYRNFTRCGPVILEFSSCIIPVSVRLCSFRCYLKAR